MALLFKAALGPGGMRLALLFSGFLEGARWHQHRAGRGMRVSSKCDVQCRRRTRQ